LSTSRVSISTTRSYADAVLWLKKGWCDYIVPQLYWKISAPQQTYPGLLQWWAEHNPKGRHLYAGLYTSRINEKETSWIPDEILGQIMIARLTPAVHGEVHFSMTALMENRKKISDQLREGLYAEPALAPAASWLHGTSPAAPISARIDLNSSSMPTLRWEHPTEETPWLWVVQVREGGAWKTIILPGNERRTVVGSGVDVAFIKAVGRCGELSKSARAEKEGRRFLP
jgi:hypothetical protein